MDRADERPLEELEPEAGGGADALAFLAEFLEDAAAAGDAAALRGGGERRRAIVFARALPRCPGAAPAAEAAARAALARAASAGVGLDLIEVRPPLWGWGLEDGGAEDDGGGEPSWLAEAVRGCPEGAVRSVPGDSARALREALSAALASALYDSGKGRGVAVAFPPGRASVLGGAEKAAADGGAQTFPPPVLQCTYVPAAACPAAPARLPTELCSCHGVPLSAPPAPPARKCRVTGRKAACSYPSSALVEFAGATVPYETGGAASAGPGAAPVELAVARAVPLSAVDEASLQGAAALLLPSDGALFDEGEIERNLAAFTTAAQALAEADVGLVATSRFDFASGQASLLDLPYLVLADARAAPPPRPVGAEGGDEGAGAGGACDGGGRLSGLLSGLSESPGLPPGSPDHERAGGGASPLDPPPGWPAASQALLLRRINLPQEELPLPAEALPPDAPAPPAAAVARAKAGLLAWAREDAEAAEGRARGAGGLPARALGETGAAPVLARLLDAAAAPGSAAAPPPAAPKRRAPATAAKPRAKPRRAPLQLRPRDA